MPRVKSQVKSTAGKERHCGRCGKKIEPGESYFKFSFRYGGTHYRCSDHYPRQSELTQSKMSEVYAAIEAAEDSLPGVEALDDIRSEVEQVGEVARQVVDEYREADEAFGGQGATQSAEMADELEGWAEELESWEPDVEEAEVDEDEIEAKMRTDGIPESDEAQWISVREERMREAEEALDNSEALEQARDQATEVLGTCPL